MSLIEDCKQLDAATSCFIPVVNGLEERLAVGSDCPGYTLSGLRSVPGKARMFFNWKLNFFFLNPLPVHRTAAALAKQL